MSGRSNGIIVPSTVSFFECLCKHFFVDHSSTSTELWGAEVDLPKGMTIEQRMDLYTTPEPNTGCILWIAGSDKDGYGKMLFNGRHRRSHSVAYELKNGPIPSGHLIQHKCDTPACCNEQHLSLGTHLSNQRDKWNKGRGHKNQYFGITKCIRGHDLLDARIDSRGWRYCKKCSFILRKEWRAKKKLEGKCLKE